MVDERCPLGWLKMLDGLVGQLGVGGFDRSGLGALGSNLGLDGLFAAQGFLVFSF